MSNERDIANETPYKVTLIATAAFRRVVSPVVLRTTDPRDQKRTFASAPAAPAARWSSGYACPGTGPGTHPSPGSWSATALTEADRRDTRNGLRRRTGHPASPPACAPP